MVMRSFENSIMQLFVCCYIYDYLYDGMASKNNYSDKEIVCFQIVGQEFNIKISRPT